MRKYTYIVAAFGAASLLFAICNMPLWLVKSSLGILGFVLSIYINIAIFEHIEENNEKHNTRGN